jgi:hypothetical protein
VNSVAAQAARQAAAAPGDLVALDVPARRVGAPHGAVVGQVGDRVRLVGELAI